MSVMTFCSVMNFFSLLDLKTGESSIVRYENDDSCSQNYKKRNKLNFYREMPKKRQFNAEDRDPRKLKLVCVG